MRIKSQYFENKVESIKIKSKLRELNLNILRRNYKKKVEKKVKIFVRIKFEYFDNKVESIKIKSKLRELSENILRIVKMMIIK